jgi:hypothetical protein
VKRQGGQTSPDEKSQSRCRITQVMSAGNDIVRMQVCDIYRCHRSIVTITSTFYSKYTVYPRFACHAAYEKCAGANDGS